MTIERTHASFFSGVGGLDLGLERAGWRTVSFSENDPYASAVLAQRWPVVPNLGDITQIASASGDWQSATLWSGGFPCQDLSIAGKRSGFEGDRSSLAFTFLDLMERYGPPAIVFENVPGILSSNAGRDMARLLREMAELGYGMAWRSLNAQYFGVPQRRLRVFIVGLRSGGDDPDGHLAALRAAEVLALGASCPGHPAAGGKTRKEAAGGPRTGLEIAGGLTRRYGKGVNTTIDDGAIVIGESSHEREGPTGSTGYAGVRLQSGDVRPSPDPGGVRAPDGLAGRLDHRSGVAATLNSGGNDGGFRTEPGEHLVAYRKATKAHDADDWERWERADMTDTLAAYGHSTSSNAVIGSGVRDDRLLPLGLDSNRYRCCGNGVVSSVAEWIGHRLLQVLEV
jgi:DNA (cytosine-5)-methyltransferase 1